MSCICLGISCMPSKKKKKKTDPTVSLCRVVIPAPGEEGAHQCRQKAPGKGEPPGWNGLHFLPAGWVAPKFSGASALCSSPYCGLGQGCGFSRLPRCFFLQEFWELERRREPVKMSIWQGIRGCRIVRWLGDCPPVPVGGLKIWNLGGL